MKIGLAVAVFLFVLVAASFFIRERAYDTGKSPNTVMPERVQLKTNDGIAIVGDYYAPKAVSHRGLMLVHMMPATRASWAAFAQKAAALGWQVLAIDLRGHGESEGGPEGYQTFSDAEHQASRADLAAAAEFLKSKGVSELSFGGASIGANLSLQYLADHADANTAFLLSPGLNYRGVQTSSAAASLHVGQAVLFVASEDDPDSASAVQKLFSKTPAHVRKAMKMFQDAGHGTAIFERQPAYMDAVLSWLDGIPRMP